MNVESRCEVAFVIDRHDDQSRVVQNLVHC